MPVKNSNSSTYIGLVNAFFSYDTFFDKLFTNKISAHDNLNVTIRDQGTVIYESKNKHGATAYASTTTATVANREWDVTIEAPADFGISASQARTPWSILVGGQIFALAGGLYLAGGHLPLCWRGGVS